MITVTMLRSALLLALLLLSAVTLAQAPYFIEAQPLGEGSRAAVRQVGPGKTYTTISAAIAASSAGDTIQVFEDVYNERLTIDKRLIFDGENADKVELIGDASGNVITISANGVEITGFSITTYASASSGHGIYITSNNNEIKECKINNNKDYGIYIRGISGEKAQNNLIEDCELTNNGDSGVYVYFSFNTTIQGCNIKDNGNHGIYFHAVAMSNVTQNKIENNAKNGIYDANPPTNSGNDNNIKNNTCSGNTFSGIFVDSKPNFGIISNNTCIGNFDGISTENINNKVIEFNTLILNEHCGMNLTEDTKSNMFTDNTLYRNKGLGMEFTDGSARANTIIRNYFVQNNGSGIQVKDNSSVATNNWYQGNEGNYWYDYNSRYPGTDHPNGFFKTPYDVPGSAGVNDSKPLFFQHYVDDDKNVGPWMGTPQYPYENITWAVSNSTNYDVIRVFDGDYVENVLVDKRVSIIGNGSSYCSVSGSLQDSVFKIRSSRVRINGFTILSSGSDTGDHDAGVNLLTSSKCTIENSTIKECYYPIYSDSCNMLSILNSTFESNTLGVYLYLGGWNKIENCTFGSNGEYGLYGSQVTDVTVANSSFNSGSTNDGLTLNNVFRGNIFNNSFENNDRGLELRTTRDCHVLENTLQDNVDGIYLYDSRYNILEENTIFENTDYGICAEPAGSVTHSNQYLANEIYENPIGIFLDRPASSYINNSHFFNNDISVFIDKGYEVGVQGNRVNHSGIGMYIFSSQSITLNQNDILNCSSGIFVNASLIATASANIFSFNNKIENCTMGVRMQNGTFFEAGFNLIKNGGVGIFALSIDNSQIYNNTIMDNTGEAVIQNDIQCEGNEFISNNFINNKGGASPQAIDNGALTRWDLNSRGNYWSDWTTPDTDFDGIVDNPYAIGGTASLSDNFPLTTPSGKPIFINENILNATIEIEYNATYNVYDPDTDQEDLFWGFQTDADWLEFTGEHWLRGTPGIDDIGSNWVNISVADNLFFTFTNFTINVSRIILPLMINGSFLPLTWTEDMDEFQIMTIDVPDVLNDSLSWSLECNNSFLNIDPVTGNLSGTPLNEHVGVHWANVTVEDPIRGNASLNFSINVKNVNDAPVFLSESLLNATQDKMYHNTYNVTDIDPTGDVLIFELNATADFLTIDALTGNLSGIPGNEHVGTWNVSIILIDGKGGTAYENFTLTVFNVNDPPTVSPQLVSVVINEDTIKEDVNLTTIFSDIDGDVLDHVVQPVENLAVSILPNGTLRFTPVKDWAGSGSFNITASDAESSVNLTVVYTVKNINDAPYDPKIELLETKYVEGCCQNISGSAKDVDLIYGDSLYYSWTSNLSSIKATGQVANLSLQAGLQLITLTVRDKEGASVQTTIEIFVEERPEMEPDDDVVDDDIVDDDIKPDDDIVDDDIQPNGTDNQTDPESSMTFYYVLIMVMIIIIIVVIAAIIYIRSRKQEPEEEEDEGEAIPEPSELPDASDMFPDDPLLNVPDVNNDVPVEDGIKVKWGQLDSEPDEPLIQDEPYIQDEPLGQDGLPDPTVEMEDDLQGEGLPDPQDSQLLGIEEEPNGQAGVQSENTGSERSPTKERELDDLFNI